MNPRALVFAMLVATQLSSPGHARIPAGESIPLGYFVSRNRVVDEGRFLGKPRPSGAVFAPDARAVSEQPVIPFLPWGLHFDEDYVISVVNDGEWGMIEVVKIALPGGKHVWFTLDSKLDGTQFVGLPSDPEAKVLASAFPAQVYDSGLEVIERDLGEFKSVRVRYVRIDGSPIEFEMKVAKAPSSPPARNGNGMNHSESRALAVLDLESFRFARGELRFEGETRRLPQRIAGVKVAGLLTQTVGGLMSGSWRQNDLSLDLDGRSLGFERLSRDGVTILRTLGQYPSIEFLYDEVGEGRLELRAVRVDQSRPGVAKEVSVIRFNPSLPDLRFGAPVSPVRSRMVMSVNGRPGYMKGEVEVAGDPDGRTTRITVLPESPDWARARPVSTRIESQAGGAIAGSSTVLSVGHVPFSRSVVEAPAASREVVALEAVDFAWAKRPHRVSALEVEPGANHYRLGGGTWANGEAASDEVRYTARVRTVGGADFHPVSTPSFDLVRASARASGSMEAKGVHDMTVRFDSLPEDSQVVAWINGFAIRSGVRHSNTGLTHTGFSVRIREVRRNGNEVTLGFELSQGFGNVPDRFQNSDEYSASGQVHAVIAVLPTGRAIEMREIHGSKSTRAAILPGSKALARRGGVLGDCQTSVSAGSPWLLGAITLTNVNEGSFPARYLRRLSFSTEPEIARDLLDNTGEMTRPSRYEIRKSLLRIPGLESQGSRCLR